MEKQVVRYSTVASAVIAAIVLPFNWRWSVGILCGLAGFRLYFFLLQSSVDELLAGGETGKISLFTSKALRMLILAVPLLFSFLFPSIINTWGTLIGLLMF